MMFCEGKLKKRKLLFVIGSYTILTLLIATIFLGVQIERSFSSLTMERMHKMGKSNTGFYKTGLRSFYIFPGGKKGLRGSALFFGRVMAIYPGSAPCFEENIHDEQRV